eukprot:12393691-Alexandrium_andersonii.AAC.1
MTSGLLDLSKQLLYLLTGNSYGCWTVDLCAASSHACSPQGAGGYIYTYIHTYGQAPELIKQ